MEKDIYQKLLKKLELVTYAPPQNLGVLTPFYKQTVPFLKSASLPILVLLSLIMAFLLRFIFGSSVVNLVSFLQHGF